MKKIKVYDKVKWHYPEGKNCTDLDSAKTHFKIIMEWLNKNNLLTPYGREIYEIGIDSDFSLTSEMVNEQGNLILQKCYKIWLKMIDYKKRPDVAVFEGCLRDVMEDKNMELDILIRIVIKKKEFEKRIGKKPTRLYLTSSDEQDITALPATKIGELAGFFAQYGAKEAIKRTGNKFKEMEVIWDSPEFKVE
ncbi:MAG: hypothetical protein K8F34_16680 [Candidatus Kuenenia stuttgartiensis]|jgi:hypothetical protein|uniref:Uncharacterized protein n=1 Tax=Kuenenia stuttgartiensis TaxID=174633 RepID=A0A2C9CKJ2_KUEST|nr:MULTISPECIES: hypothetical protein [Kuenenia]MBE7549195.1 hypothetical protein [Planctomycetia bacterium]MCZ7611865.1 hypothetical protein [Ignavibacterium sp.]MBZ0193306.1 hypothetical protein [Candidatus Kuenenia stuttgartiensis]MCL4728226.1 hypothetical protein [Candidatus Kuenenia stuttgartiensis]MCZ7622132.1 hypothetical protein [Candidatus Kuenenia sp.]